MELYPIYEENTKIAKNIWYSLSGLGECPFMRVGHSIVHLKKEDTERLDKGKFFIIGGANPSGSFNDVYIFDLNTLSWDKLDEMDSFKTGRYEHSCFLDSRSNNVLIFGGSSEAGTFNDLLKFDFESKKCEHLPVKSNAPSPRTIHSGVGYKNQLVVFGGGVEGKTPVADQNVYIYNAASDKWISLSLTKNSKVPAARQGHLMLNYKDDLVYLHGGMSEDAMFDDFWCLNLKTIVWQLVEFDKSDMEKFPCARAAHGGVCINRSVYIFGGIDPAGAALNDLWKFNVESNQWSLIEIFGYKPPSRLDFAYCKASFIKAEEPGETSLLFPSGDSTEQPQVNRTETAKALLAVPSDNSNTIQEKFYQFLVVHGGMDTEGNVFDDFYFINLE